MSADERSSHGEFVIEAGELLQALTDRLAELERAAQEGGGRQTGATVLASPDSTSHLTASDNLVTGNTFAGLSASNAGATLIASGNTVTKNGNVGLGQVNLAEVLTRLNNTASGNNAGGAQTSGLIGRLDPL